MLTSIWQLKIVYYSSIILLSAQSVKMYRPNKSFTKFRRPAAAPNKRRRQFTRYNNMVNYRVIVRTVCARNLKNLSHPSSEVASTANRTTFLGLNLRLYRGVSVYRHVELQRHNNNTRVRGGARMIIKIIVIIISHTCPGRPLLGRSR